MRRVAEMDSRGVKMASLCWLYLSVLVPRSAHLPKSLKQ